MHWAMLHRCEYEHDHQYFCAPGTSAYPPWLPAETAPLYNHLVRARGVLPAGAPAAILSPILMSYWSPRICPATHSRQNHPSLSPYLSAGLGFHRRSLSKA